MRNLNKLEKNLLRFIDSNNKTTKNEIINSLKETLGFSYEESNYYYKLWYFLNGRDYDELLFDENKTDLKNYVKTIVDSDNPDDYIDEIYKENESLLRKIYGDNFNYHLRDTPSLDWTSEGLKLNLSYEDWDMYFSGLNEDSIHFYYEMGSGYIDHSYEVDEEEFNYVVTDDETIELLSHIALLKNLNNWPGKNTEISDYEVNDFLKKSLDYQDYKNLKEEYIDSMSYYLKHERLNQIKEIYKNEVKYDKDDCFSEYSDVCILIPYSNLLEIIEEENLFNLSELFDSEINGRIDLLSDYYSIWLNDDDKNNLLNDLNDGLKKIIDNIVEESDYDLDKIIILRNDFFDLIEKLGFKKQTEGVFFYKNLVSFNINDVDFEGEKIKINYIPNNSDHVIPIEDLPNWISGSVLDLNESVRYNFNKKVLKGMKEEIEKITIFDFDGTLLSTPHPEEGIPLWESFTKKKYPHIGWWSKPESLDDTIFEINPIKPTVKKYLEEVNKPNNLVIMLTGRLPQQSLQVEELLHLNNLYFDEYHYKGNGDTLSSKINTIKNLLIKYPKVNKIEMFEDREPHAIEFLKWGKENGVNIKVNLVKNRI